MTMNSSETFSCGLPFRLPDQPLILTLAALIASFMRERRGRSHRGNS